MVWRSLGSNIVEPPKNIFEVLNVFTLAESKLKLKKTFCYSKQAVIIGGKHFFEYKQQNWF